MRYILKKDSSDKIKKKYKNTYFQETIGLCGSYVSMIVNRRKAVPKNVAYTMTKSIDDRLEINNIFDIVK